MQHKVELFSDARHIEFSPPDFVLSTDEERLAALVGYMTGDGALTTGRARYQKADGTVSNYERLHGAFYSNVKADLLKIQNDCHCLDIASGASVHLKRTKPGFDDGYQLQIGPIDSARLISAGSPLGKKTAQQFDVPRWITTGNLLVKRAYIAALFGAEGTLPTGDRSSKSRLPRQPTLNMCKLDGFTADKFFEQLVDLLADLGIKAVTTVTGVSYKTYWLRVASGPDNLIRFFEDIGYAYCQSKNIRGWQWAKYLRSYRTAAMHRRRAAVEMRDEGEKYETIGAAIGLSKGAVHRLLASIDAGSETTAGHSFPHFEEWIASRWIDDLGLLRLQVLQQSYRPEPVKVWNMLVGSPDHSYLLASGANNFNSFETMSGRVYYPFDRKKHIKDCAYNPSLPIYIGQDFNIDPMSSVIIQEQLNGEIWVVDELYLRGSNTQETADELQRRYYKVQNQVIIYPDPAGNSRTQARGESSLDILREAGFKNIKFKPKHPAVDDRINAVNRLLMTAEGTIRLYVDYRCRHFIESLEQTIYKEGSRQVDKDPGNEHITDAFGYYADFRHPMRKMRILGVTL